MTAIPTYITEHVKITYHSIIVAPIFLSVALVLCGAEAATAAVPTHAVIWGSLALGSYLLGLLFLVGRANTSGLGLANWKFGSWILFWYALTFGLATITWSKPQPSPSNEIAVGSVLHALWLIAVGMTFLVIGYFVGPGAPLRRAACRGMGAMAKRRSSVVRSQLTPWALYLIGTLARLISTASTGRFGYVGNPATGVSSAGGYDQVLTQLSLFCPFAICAAALQVYRERQRRARVTLAILTVTEIGVGAAAGGKQSFVVVMMAIVIPMSAARYRLPATVIIPGIAAFLLIIIPFNQAYRNAVRGGTGPLSTSQAISESPHILWQAVTDQSITATATDSTTYLLQRLDEIGSPAIIMQRTPGQIPYLNPAELVEAPLLDTVPRAIWPGKPILDPGYEFSQQYYGIPPSIYTASAISPVGDLYRHGGWPPVILGMTILGCGVRFLDDVLNVRMNPHAMLLVILLFPTLVKGESDWVGLIAGLPAVAFTWLLAIGITFRSITATSDEP